MTENPDTRTSDPSDLPTLESLYREAFPSEDLVPFLQDLLCEGPTVLSRVGTIHSTIVCHAVFTRCSVSNSSLKVALLGPLAVASKWQRQGLGRAILGNGLKMLAADGVSRVCVLGDPAYYRRLGFENETGILPPYPLPEEWQSAWQSISLGKTDAACVGKLVVPQPWRQPALWGP